MELINTISIEIKKSKFIAYYYKIDNINEVKEVLDILWKNNKKARHIPYAYILNNSAKKSDDKEPSNTAGMPIYKVLEREKINNSIIAVVRYFGGIKLGSGGLIRAYSEAANKVIKKEK